MTTKEAFKADAEHAGTLQWILVIDMFKKVSLNLQYHRQKKKIGKFFDLDNK